LKTINQKTVSDIDAGIGMAQLRKNLNRYVFLSCGKLSQYEREELIQNALLVLITDEENIRDHWQYLKQVVRNLALKSRTQFMSRLKHAANEHEETKEIRCNRLGPEAALEQKQALAGVDRRVNWTNPLLQAVGMALMGHTHKEIAQAQGTPVGTAKSRVFYGKEALAMELSK